MVQWLATILILTLSGCTSQLNKKDTPVVTKPTTTQKLAEPDRKSDAFNIPRGSTFSSALKKAGVRAKESHSLIQEVRKSLDLRRIRPQTSIEIKWVAEKSGPLYSLKIRRSKTESLLFERLPNGKSWKTTDIIRAPTEISNTYSGSVTTSLWDSAQKKGIDPTLIMEIAEIFSWAFDFNREVRQGDRWRLVVTEQFIDGELIGRLPIEVAEYQTGKDSIKAIYFKGKSETYGSYFYPDGKSLKRVFLKSPISFGRVTSRFNRRRYHPILKKKIPHNGVDYGAPKGTPVHSVGEGRVTFAGRKGASGIMVKVRHNATYTTSYLHLNGIRKGVRRGKRVNQGQTIGYVGSTGRATGPHLHFAFYENGRFVDPLGRKFPSKDPVPKNEIPVFLKVAETSLAKFPKWKKPEVVSWYLPDGKLGSVKPIF